MKLKAKGTSKKTFSDKGFAQTLEQTGGNDGCVVKATKGKHPAKVVAPEDRA